MPRKFGQHFLIRDSVLARIAEACCGEFEPRVIEIGPGKGALTRYLLPRTDELHAIEVDPQLIPILAAKFQDDPKFHLHQADVLKTDLSQWGPGVIAGNLPYYITSPILTQFFSLDDRFSTAVFLIQHEVGERLRASPGSRDYGFLSVETQLFCDVEWICDVPASAFAPPPKVESAVVRLRRRSSSRPTKELLLFVGRCFAHKRKMLRNNLRPFYSLTQINSLPEAGHRAEQIPIQRFIELHQQLSAGQSDSKDV